MINDRRVYILFAVAVLLLNWTGTMRAQSR